MNEEGFKIAFGVGDFLTREILADKNHVKWLVKLITGLNQKQLRFDEIPYHKCTEEDYGQFYPPNMDSVNMFEIAQNELELFCLDTDKILEIRGQDNFDYQRLDIIYMPCTEDLQAGTCVGQSYEDMIAYLGVPELYLVVNRQRLDLGEYDEEKMIIKESIVIADHLEIDRARIMKTVI